MKQQAEMVYKIERGIKRPVTERQRKYPFPELEVGDSFFVPTTNVNHRSRATVLGACMHYAAKKLSRKFSQRSVDGGLRVWRIK